MRVSLCQTDFFSGRYMLFASQFLLDSDAQFLAIYSNDSSARRLFFHSDLESACFDRLEDAVPDVHGPLDGLLTDAHVQPPNLGGMDQAVAVRLRSFKARLGEYDPRVQFG